MQCYSELFLPSNHYSWMG